MPPYTRQPNEFFDPAGNLPNYLWHINALEQEGPFRSDNVEFNGTADGRGLVPVGGSYEPLIITLTGTILHKAQDTEFWKWRHLENSFRFTDFELNSYEVSMLSYEPKKVRVALNPMDFDNMPGYKIEYSMKLWIIRIISGNLYDADVPT
jgi:hypothetical protein